MTTIKARSHVIQQMRNSASQPGAKILNLKTLPEPFESGYKQPVMQQVTLYSGDVADEASLVYVDRGSVFLNGHQYWGVVLINVSVPEGWETTPVDYLLDYSGGAEALDGLGMVMANYGSDSDSD